MGESYIIAGPCWELSEVLKMLEKATGIPLPRFAPPPFFLRSLSRLVSAVNRLRPLEGLLSPETLRVMGGATYLGSSAKATSRLGIEMRPLETGLIEVLPGYLEWAGVAAAQASSSRPGPRGDGE